MIKKIVMATLPALLLSTSLQVQAAGQMSLEFSAASPVDQLAWADIEDQSRLASLDSASKDSGKKNWDPLGLTAQPKSSGMASVVPSNDALLKTVSAKKIGLKNKKSAENIWDFIH